ncbi:response regulator [bacterium]|nr:response regulator [bacterium]
MTSKDKILIVDDEREAVEPLIRAFELEGYEMAYAADGTEALRMVKQAPFNLILLDVMMPQMNGYMTLKHLQEDETTAYIPVIFVTGHFNEEEIVKGFEMGAVDAISKPFRLSEVMVRSRIRIAEAKLKRRYTPVTHFFAEAQEKEHSRRTGSFEFYNHTKSKIGEIFIEDGKVVYATSKDAIKEDAFLQLAASRGTTYMFQESTRAPNKTLSANITSLILEASKIVDEMESKEIRDDQQTRVLIIDRERIPRILASRVLKASGYTTMVTGAEEISQETSDKFDPHVVVVDHTDGEMILGKIKLTRPDQTPIPVIVYSDDDHIESLNEMKKVGPFNVQAVLLKTHIDQSLSSAVHHVLHG